MSTLFLMVKHGMKATRERRKTLCSAEARKPSAEQSLRKAMEQRIRSQEEKKKTMILTSGKLPPFEPETDVEEEIAKAPPLSREQEQVLLCQIKQGGAGGKAARTRLIEAHVHLAFRIARRYTSHTCVLEYHDLVQEGQIGLICAADSFKAGRGQTFSEYATRRIHRAIKRALAENRSAHPLPDASWTALRTIQWTEQRLIQQQHQPPADEELALATHLSVEWMHTLRGLHTLVDPCSLDQPGYSASEEESMPVGFVRLSQPLEKTVQIMMTISERVLSPTTKSTSTDPVPALSEAETKGDTVATV